MPSWSETLPHFIEPCLVTIAPIFGGPPAFQLPCTAMALSMASSSWVWFCRTRST